MRLFDPLGRSDSKLLLSMSDPDRLALNLVGSTNAETMDPALGGLREFWERAVFLRLSPNRLADGSPASRKSYEPMLDEEGQNLPALLNELQGEPREDLVQALRE